MFVSRALRLSRTSITVNVKRTVFTLKNQIHPQKTNMISKIVHFFFFLQIFTFSYVKWYFKRNCGIILFIISRFVFVKGFLIDNRFWLGSRLDGDIYPIIPVSLDPGSSARIGSVGPSFEFSKIVVTVQLFFFYFVYLLYFRDQERVPTIKTCIDPCSDGE